MSAVTEHGAPPRGLVEPTLGKKIRSWVANPWGHPRFLVVITWLYVVISIVPAVVAIQFSFNAGRSVTAWQGFDLTRWYFGDPAYSVWHDPRLQHAFWQSLKLAGLDMAIATPLGVLLALGLARWRGPLASASNFIMLFPLVTPELMMGVSLFLVFLHIFKFIQPGTTAQVLGHVTFSLSYVVVIVRGRLFSIGKQYEEAAADLGATPAESLRLVLLPLLLPAVFSSLMMVFAISIDDFVISQWLSCGSECDTVPIRVYSSTRGAPLPSVNALAAIMVYMTLSAIGIAYLAYRFMTRGERRSGEHQRGGMVQTMGGFDM
ncbi:MAG TPA: ABC transporter permease [Candidatus Binatia bacterium]|nr:ABC transporter permease [Candidatus Binatia bacterium]